MGSLFRGRGFYLGEAVSVSVQRKGVSRGVSGSRGFCLGGLGRGVSVQGVSERSLFRGRESLSREGGLCIRGGRSLSRGSLCSGEGVLCLREGVSVQAERVSVQRRGSLSREGSLGGGVSVQGRRASVQGREVSVQGRGSLSSGIASLECFCAGGLCSEEEVSLEGRGSLSRGGGPCSEKGVSVQGSLSRGSLSRGGVSDQGVSVQGRGSLQGRGLCPGEMVSVSGLCQGKGPLSTGVSLSRRFLSGWSTHRGFFVQGGIWGSLSRGRESLQEAGVSVQGRGSLSRLGDLCPGKGSLSRVGESLFREREFSV